MIELMLLRHSQEFIIAICYERVGLNPKGGYFNAPWRNWEGGPWQGWMWWPSETGYQEAWLLGIYLDKTTEVPGLALGLTGLESQPYQWSGVDHTWEGQFMLS